MAKKTNVLDTWKHVLAIDREISDLKTAREALMSSLQSAIPAGAELDGVKHTAYKKPSVSYTKLVDLIRDELVPKTKHASIEILKKQCTSETEIHRVTGPKEVIE